MDWTIRKIGHRMRTHRPRFDLSGVDYVKAVAVSNVVVGSTMSRAEVEKTVRQELHNYGRSHLDWFGDRVSDDPEYYAKAWPWARDQVIRHWPKLAGEIPETYAEV